MSLLHSTNLNSNGIHHVVSTGMNDADTKQHSVHHPVHQQTELFHSRESSSSIISAPSTATPFSQQTVKSMPPPPPPKSLPQDDTISSIIETGNTVVVNKPAAMISPEKYCANSARSAILQQLIMLKNSCQTLNCVQKGLSIQSDVTDNEQLEDNKSNNDDTAYEIFQSTQQKHQQDQERPQIGSCDAKLKRSFESTVNDFESMQTVQEFSDKIKRQRITSGEPVGQSIFQNQYGSFEALANNLNVSLMTESETFSQKNRITEIPITKIGLDYIKNHPIKAESTTLLTSSNANIQDTKLNFEVEVDFLQNNSMINRYKTSVKIKRQLKIIDLQKSLLDEMGCHLESKFCQIQSFRVKVFNWNSLIPLEMISESLSEINVEEKFSNCISHIVFVFVIKIFKDLSLSSDDIWNVTEQILRNSETFLHGFQLLEKFNCPLIKSEPDTFYKLLFNTQLYPVLPDRNYHSFSANNPNGKRYTNLNFFNQFNFNNWYESDSVRMNLISQLTSKPILKENINNNSILHENSYKSSQSEKYDSTPRTTSESNSQPSFSQNLSTQIQLPLIILPEHEKKCPEIIKGVGNVEVTAAVTSNLVNQNNLLLNLLTSQSISQILSNQINLSSSSLKSFVPSLPISVKLPNLQDNAFLPKKPFNGDKFLDIRNQNKYLPEQHNLNGTASNLAANSLSIPIISVIIDKILQQTNNQLNFSLNPPNNTLNVLTNNNNTSSSQSCSLVQQIINKIINKNNLDVPNYYSNNETSLCSSLSMISNPISSILPTNLPKYSLTEHSLEINKEAKESESTANRSGLNIITSSLWPTNALNQNPTSLHCEKLPQLALSTSSIFNPAVQLASHSVCSSFNSASAIFNESSFKSPKNTTMGNFETTLHPENISIDMTITSSSNMLTSSSSSLSLPSSSFSFCSDAYKPEISNLNHSSLAHFIVPQSTTFLSTAAISSCNNFIMTNSEDLTSSCSSNLDNNGSTFVAVHSISSSALNSSPSSNNEFSSNNEYFLQKRKNQRQRVTFMDKDLRQLEEWFQQNAKPHREVLELYAEKLNESRRQLHGPYVRPLDTKNIVYWFKNARAHYKKVNCETDSSLPHPPQSSKNPVSVSPALSSSSNNRDREKDRNLSRPSCSVAACHKLDSNADNADDADDLSSVLSNEMGRCTAGTATVTETSTLNVSSVDGNVDDDCVTASNTAKGSISFSRFDSGCASLPTQQMMSQHQQFKESKVVSNANANDTLAVSEDDDEDEEDEMDAEEEESNNLHNRNFSCVVTGDSEDSAVLSPSTIAADCKPFSILSESASSSTHSLGANYAQNNKPKRRQRIFLDPQHEVRLLSKWFQDEQYPGSNQIDHYTQLLNSTPFRMKQDRQITAENVALWFKNHRAKMKKCNKIKTEPNPSASVQSENESDEPSNQEGLAMSALRMDFHLQSSLCKTSKSVINKQTTSVNGVSNETAIKNDEDKNNQQ